MRVVRPLRPRHNDAKLSPHPQVSWPVNVTDHDSVIILVYVRAGGATRVALATVDEHEDLAPETVIARSCPGATVLAPGGVVLGRITAHLTALTAAPARAAAADPGSSARSAICLFTGNAFSDDREVALSDGEFAVAAALALNRRARSREEWCERLWPDRDPESAARLLKVYVHRIRAKFGFPGVIETHGNAYRLGHDVAVDLESLETLARTPASRELDPDALRSVQRAFAGFESQRYARLRLLEDYAEVERRLTVTAVELGRLLVHHALLGDDHGRALAIAEGLAALDPYDEVAAELLIRTHVGLGRHDAASRSFRNFCRTLHDELDLPPPPHLSYLLQTSSALATR
jgi:DNA-binding SARP family transcriptional activator